MKGQDDMVNMSIPFADDGFAALVPWMKGNLDRLMDGWMGLEGKDGRYGCMISVFQIIS